MYMTPPTDCTRTLILRNCLLRPMALHALRRSSSKAALPSYHACGSGVAHATATPPGTDSRERRTTPCIIRRLGMPLLHTSAVSPTQQQRRPGAQEHARLKELTTGYPARESRMTPQSRTQQENRGAGGRRTSEAGDAWMWCVRTFQDVSEGGTVSCSPRGGVVAFGRWCSGDRYCHTAPTTTS